MNIKKHFDRLGIPPTNDENVIKRAYRKKAFKYHPDRNPSEKAQEEFIQITESYQKILEALERAKNPRPTYTRRQTQQETPEERQRREAERRFREARRRYEYIKQKREEASIKHFQKITTGIRWNLFKFMAITSTVLSFLFVIDITLLPKSQKSSYVHSKSSYSYSGIRGIKVAYVHLENGDKLWVPSQSIRHPWFDHEPIYYEETMFFKEKIRGTYIQEGHSIYFVAEHNVATTYPFVPIILLLPLIVVAIKERTFIFLILYNICVYWYPVILLILLISKNRWWKILTLGFG